MARPEFASLWRERASPVAYPFCDATRIESAGPFSLLHMTVRLGLPSN